MRIWLVLSVIAISFLLLFGGFTAAAQAEDPTPATIEATQVDVPAQGTPVPPETITATLALTGTQWLTATIIPTEWMTPAAPLTATITVTPTLEPTPTQKTWYAYFPVIFHSIPPPPAPRSLLFCRTPNLFVPDDYHPGVADTLSLSESGQVIGVRAYLRVNHSWVGDLTAWLEHAGKSAKLFDRPGVPASSLGCGLSNVRAIFDDGMERQAENKCFNAYSAPAIGGSFQPWSSFGTFFNTPASGDWLMHVSDEEPNDGGTLVEWCLELKVLDATPTPTPPPTPAVLPGSAFIDGMWGRPQAYPLDCESRSAVEWARHWGVNIDELEFYWGLPHSDNPETGFVGNVLGEWGQVPPNDYGVHAAPIAARLQAYGLNAEPRKYMRWDEARAEIAAGRPVIVWILGTIWPGAPRYYRPSDGSYTVTAPYEHTMVLVGYSADTVWLLNRDTILTRSLESFLDSWSALANMGVVYVPQN